MAAITGGFAAALVERLSMFPAAWALRVAVSKSGSNVAIAASVSRSTISASRAAG